MELEPKVPVMVADVFDFTAFVVIVKVAVEEPTATLTDEDTDADVEDDFKLTVIAPLAGTAFSVIVPVAEAPPITVDGEIERPVIVNG